jgi:hypothetical protein
VSGPGVVGARILFRRRGFVVLRGPLEQLEHGIVPKAAGDEGERRLGLRLREVFNCAAKLLRV